MNNDEIQHRTESEVSASEEYARLRDAIARETGGIIIESTDDGRHMAAATFQPDAVEGPTITIAHRGVPQADGGTEHGEATVESYERPAAGAELKSDAALYARRLAAFKEQHPDFDAVVGREDVEIPIAVQRTVIRLSNGPELAYFLGNNLEVVSDLCKMDPFEAAVFAREIGTVLETDRLDPDASYEQYKLAMNRHEARRRATRRRNG